MELFVVDNASNPRLIEVKVGLKVEVRDNVLKQIQDEKYIADNFKLNIKRLNRWRYSVYFDKKEN